LEFGGNGEKDDVFWVDAKVFAQIEGAIHGYIIIVTIYRPKKS